MPTYPETFVHGRKELEFKYTTGEVIGTNKFSETHVSSTGGGGTVGGYIGPYGGHVSGDIDAPEIKSEVITKHEFWIRKDDGEEMPVKLSGVDIPLRAGQIITVIGAYMRGEKNGWYSLLVNHNAGKHWFIKDAGDLNKTFRLETPTGRSVLIALAFVGISYLVLWNIDPYRRSGLWEFVFIAAVAFVIYRVVSKLTKASRLKKRLQEHLDGLVQRAQKDFQKAAAQTR